MWLSDNTNRQYQLGKPIGYGGEASIYEIMGDEDALAKIFKNPRPGYAQKLGAMLENPPDDPASHLGHTSLAWPKTLLFDQNGKFTGYTMPYVRHAELLLSVFNPRLRAKVLPDFNQRYIYRTARNLAATLEAIHHRGYVVGDLNESNILVKQTALVTIIDTDSFQVRAKNRFGNLSTFPCPVGKPEYTPPELQGKTFDRIRRQEEHDRFALAVIIFQLIMGGIHPFKAQWIGVDEPPPIEIRIRKGWYPYNPKNRGPVDPPIHSLPMETLHPNLTTLFQQCFIKGHKSPKNRPTAGEWEKALAKAESALIQCEKGHIFSSHLKKCGFCYPIVSKPSLRTSISRNISSRITNIQKLPQKFPVLFLKVKTFFKRIKFPTIQSKYFRKYFKQQKIFRRVHVSPSISWQFILQITVPTLFLAVSWGLLSNTGSSLLPIKFLAISGGFLSGAMLSEIIQKSIGWSWALAGIGAVSIPWFLSATNNSMSILLPAGIVGMILGFLIGKIGQRKSWLVISALLGTFGGYQFVSMLGVFITGSWVNGMFSGAGYGLLVAFIYQLWARVR